MKKSILFASVIAGAMLVSCNSSNSAGRLISDIIHPVSNVLEKPVAQNQIIRSTVKDYKGNNMLVAYNKDKGTAVIDLNGEIINMVQDVTASGVRMHNSEYLYEESQGEITLKKNGVIVFDNREIINTTVTNKQGKKMDMNFHNNNNTLVLKLDGEEIFLRGDTTASGLRYRNANYIYEESKGHGVLKKNGRVVFDSTR